MKHRLYLMLRRATVISFVAVLALAATAFIGGSGNDNTSVDSGELASADSRTGEQSASRGAPRSSAADFIAAASTSNQLVAPADDDPTTTTSTEAPTTTTTTAAPVTTTTAAPTTTAVPKPAAPKPASSGNTESGKASYYAYRPGGCADKTIPKGTTLTVTNTANGKTATCVVNDRGPFVAGRIIDLDVTVFKQIASTSAGVASVRITW